MKNYYELLEVSRFASQEVIEKAYKALAKKYHPDLQEGASKKEAEKKMKEINEAYEIISNPEKRENYDKEIERLEQEKQQAQNNYRDINQANNNVNYNQQVNNSTRQEQELEYKILQEQILQEQIKFEQEKQQAINKAYYDAYIQDLKNRGYKIKYKKTFKEHIKSIRDALIAIAITILVLFIISKIPPVRKYFVNLYNQNAVIKLITDIFVSIVESIKDIFK